jgi:asparagine synthase (glutamine-hydrolysing)
MCGICGQLNPDGRPVDRAVLEAMNAAIRHRGPDSDGFLVRGHVGLAMRRLAILDLVTGDQPIGNEDGSIQVVFNGEIYNYPTLRPQLEAKGHVFRTHSDTEAIVHLYEDHGADCVKHLRGMFAFALWDSRKNRLLLARDRLGKKPLYYAEHAGSLVFASEIKALLTVPGMPRTMDLEAIHHYLTLQYVPDPLSGFSAIRKLPPAHVLIHEQGRTRIERYWDLPFEPKWTEPEADLVAGLRERVREAVRIRLLSDVPLGAHLSGGIDSSLIVALMAEAGGTVRTFSIGFEEERFSELPHARAVAQRFGTDHHEFVVTYGDVPAQMEALAAQFDEPFADSSALPMWHLAQLTRRHVTVALNGDGGDELFAGYQRYRLDRFADAYAHLPAWFTQRLIPALLRSAREPVNVPIEANWVAGLKRLNQVAATPRGASIIRWGSYFSDPMKASLWRPDVRASFRATPSAEWLAAVYRTAPARSPLDRTLYTDITNYLPGDLLVKADRMTMAHSLEGRSPLLDHELAQWAARLPERYKQRGKLHKVLLKQAFADLLPPAIATRGKQGFGIPLGAWFRGPLAPWARDIILDPSARIASLFQPAPLAALLNAHAHGQTDHGKRLWTLLMLELWLRQSGAGRG